MANTANHPKTLMEAVTYFADKNRAVAYLEGRRWPNGVECQCGSKNVTAIRTRQLWQCKECRKQFSVKVGTIFEDSPLALGRWLTAYWMLTNCRNGISSCELARSIGVTQKTAWFMLHRIRETMKDGSKLSGTVEADETFIGGKVHNKHASRRRSVNGSAGKTIVSGAVERGGRARAKVIDGMNARTMRGAVLEHVEQGSTLYTDEATPYKPFNKIYDHDSVNHSKEEYVRGEVHTNTIENYWSLVKRMLKGTYIHVQPFHLDRYLTEQSLRYNVRKEKEDIRLSIAVSNAPGHRLMYKELIGKVLAT